MRRRDFIAGIGATAAGPLASRAQQTGGMRRIGWLSQLPRGEAPGSGWLNAFKHGLADLGWTEGRNLAFEERWADNDVTLLPLFAAQLVATSPDLIFVTTSTPLTAVRRATGTIPIVFAIVTDPVGQGYVSSLAQPGGNITGFANYEFPLATKHLDLLKKIAPGVARVSVLYDPLDPLSIHYLSGYLGQIEIAGPILRVEVSKIPVSNADEIVTSITALARADNGGLLILASQATAVHRELIVSLAAQHRLPALYSTRTLAAAGGLASYSADEFDLCRRAASYTDLILRGAKPADLPVQLPTKYSFVLNLKTARAIGLDIPGNVLALADEVID